MLKADNPIKKQKTVWLVAAGTGGHIFPGIALANELIKRDPNLSVEFFGTRDRLESKIIPSHGFKLNFLSAKQWKGRGVLTRIQSLWALIISTFLVFKKVGRDRPQFLVSVGGYVSMPVGLACWLRGVPLYLVEPNIRAGVSNKLLSQIARKAFTIPGGDALTKFKCSTIDTGNPVVGNYSSNPIRKEAVNLLILGGSQGARILCHVGLAAFAALRTHGIKAQVCLQSGDKNLADALELKQSLKLGEECDIRPFVQDMPVRLQWADVVVARAGAMTLSELALGQVPSVLVPFPAAADDHQRVNARLLESAGAALVVEEKDKDFGSKLELALLGLFSASDGLAARLSLGQNLSKFARPRAAESIVTEILASL